MELTEQAVRDLWIYMSQEYGTTLVDKRTAPEMKLASKFVPTPDFLNNYATTIGKRIYLPFRPGYKNDNGWSLLAQVKVCAHEHMHVEQLGRDGLRFPFQYIISTAERARYEAEAYVCNMQLQYAVLGFMNPTAETAGNLVSYGCKPADITNAKVLLDVAQNGIEMGVIVNRPSRRVIDFLTTRGVLSPRIV